jgi:hypothetical protein
LNDECLATLNHFNTIYINKTWMTRQSSQENKLTNEFRYSKNEFQIKLKNAKKNNNRVKCELKLVEWLYPSNTRSFWTNSFNKTPSSPLYRCCCFTATSKGFPL